MRHRRLHHKHEPESGWGRAFWAAEGFAYGLVFLAIMFMPGCASAPREVDVPVPVACSPALPPAPAYPDTDQALKELSDPFLMVQLLLEGRIERIQRDAELTAALDACRAVPPPPSSPAPKPSAR